MEVPLLAHTRKVDAAERWFLGVPQFANLEIGVPGEFTRYPVARGFLDARSNADPSLRSG
jgi:hypothetical protein